MATTKLFPISETDASANIQSGSFTDIDTGVDAPSGTPLSCQANSWTDQSDNTQGGEIIFGLTDAPGDFATFNSVQLRVRALVTGGGAGDAMEWRAEIEGTNAPSSVVAWDETDDAGGYVERNFTDSAVTPSAADIDGWTVHIYQWTYNQDMGPDGLQWDIDEIELILDYDVGAVTRTADGTPDIASPTASGTANVIRKATSAVTLAAITAAGLAAMVQDAAGAPSLEVLTASGTATTATVHTATAALTVGELTAVGNAIIWPTVYLNTTQSTVGADLMTVTAVNEAGTSITFDDPAGGKTGALFLGVENARDEIGWIAVTVITTRTASGTPSLAALTTANTVELIHPATATPALGELTAAGTATAVGALVTASGTPSLAGPTSTAIVNVLFGSEGTPTVGEITAAGNVTVTAHVTASGTPSLAALTTANTVELTHPATGTPSLPELTSAGLTAVGGVVVASGAPSLEALTTANTVELTHPATGTPSLPELTSAGVTAVGGIVVATGTPSLAALTTANTVELTHPATGTPSLPELTSAGLTAVGGVVVATGTPSLPELTAAGTASAVGTLITASGTPSIAGPAAAGTTKRIITARVSWREHIFDDFNRPGPDPGPSYDADTPFDWGQIEIRDSVRAEDPDWPGNEPLRNWADTYHVTTLGPDQYVEVEFDGYVNTGGEFFANGWLWLRGGADTGYYLFLSPDLAANNSLRADWVRLDDPGIQVLVGADVAITGSLPDGIKLRVESSADQITTYYDIGGGWVELLSPVTDSTYQGNRVGFGFENTDPDNKIGITEWSAGDKRLHAPEIIASGAVKVTHFATSAAIVGVERLLLDGTNDSGDANPWLVDTGFPFGAVDGLVGHTVRNLTDGSQAIITSNTAGVVYGTLAGGAENDWDPGDVYNIVIKEAITASGGTKLTHFASGTPSISGPTSSAVIRIGEVRGAFQLEPVKPVQRYMVSDARRRYIVVNRYKR